MIFLNNRLAIIDLMELTSFKENMADLNKCGNLKNMKSAGRSGSFKQMKSRFRSEGGINHNH
jgi:hypothetical protein